MNHSILSHYQFPFLGRVTLSFLTVVEDRKEVWVAFTLGELVTPTPAPKVFWFLWIFKSFFFSSTGDISTDKTSWQGVKSTCEICTPQEYNFEVLFC